MNYIKKWLKDFNPLIWTLIAFAILAVAGCYIQEKYFPKKIETHKA